MKILSAGESEGFKGLWHALILCLAAGAVVYNVAAFVDRNTCDEETDPDTRPRRKGWKDKHLAVNAAFYTTLCVVESVQLDSHWK